MREARQVCIKCLSHIEDDGCCPQCGVIYNFKTMCRFCDSYQFGNPIFECDTLWGDGSYKVRNNSGICSNLTCFGYQVSNLGFVVSNMFKRFPLNMYQERNREIVEDKFVIYENFLVKVYPNSDNNFIHQSIMNILYKRFWVEK